jgi:hypothetical protein
MSDLVRARLNGFEKNLGRAFAESTEGVEILDEPTTNPDGTLRSTTRAGGRRVKPKTTVAKQAAEKKAAPGPASTPEEANE